VFVSQRSSTTTRKIAGVVPFRLFSEKPYRIAPAMTPEDRDRMIELCKRIARETDPERLASWIEELQGTIQSKIRELREARRTS
jgi:hypothetical protein